MPLRARAQVREGALVHPTLRDGRRALTYPYGTEAHDGPLALQSKHICATPETPPFPHISVQAGVTLVRWLPLRRALNVTGGVNHVGTDRCACAMLGMGCTSAPPCLRAGKPRVRPATKLRPMLCVHGP
jgi:hypothetical protein